MRQVSKTKRELSKLKKVLPLSVSEDGKTVTLKDSEGYFGGAPIVTVKKQDEEVTPEDLIEKLKDEIIRFNVDTYVETFISDRGVGTTPPATKEIIAEAEGFRKMLTEWYFSIFRCLRYDPEEIEEFKIELLEEVLPLSFSDNGKLATLEDWATVSGEDIILEVYDKNKKVTTDDILEELETYVKNFDIDDYVEMYIDSRGERGVPETVRGLLDAAEEHKQMLLDWLTTAYDCLNVEKERRIQYE